MKRDGISAMVNPLWYGVGAYAAAELYERTPPEFKSWVKKTFKIHHGTAGGIIEVAGLATGNLPMISTGAGFMFHDRKDAPEWPKDIEMIKSTIIQKGKEILHNLKNQNNYYI